MILDERNEFCDATALNTGAAGTYLIGDVIDTGGDGRDGSSDGLYLVIQVDTAATSGTSAATVQFTLASDSTASIATDGTATEHYKSAATVVTSLTAGTQVCAVELPRGSYERYLGILQTTGVEAVTAGKVNAFLTNNPNDYVAMPDAVPTPA
jgi:hypothetical protein